jgi:hypothetical protein
MIVDTMARLKQDPAEYGAITAVPLRARFRALSHSTAPRRH